MKASTKVILILAFFIYHLSTCIYPQEPDTIWTKTYGSSGIDHSAAIEQTSDGGYIIVGHKQYEIWLLKTDADGDTLWTKNFGGTFGGDVKQTTDGGYIITGSKMGIWYDEDVALIKTDSLGNVIWEKTFGTLPLDDPIIDAGYSVQQTSDKGFVVVGIKGLMWYPGFPSDLWLIKTDSVGNLQWSKVYQSPFGVGNESGNSIQITSDSGFLIGGFEDASNYSRNIWLLKTNSAGDTLWTKIYGGNGEDQCNSVQITADGEFIIAGSTKSFGAGEDDVWLIKTDENGDTLWTKTFGGVGSEESYSAKQTNDGGLIISGYTDSYGAGEDDLWLIRTDENGHKLWTKTLGGINDESGSSVFHSEDNGYVVTGYTKSFGAGESDVWLIKLEPDTIGIINVVQPNGGEHWLIGESKKILWASNNIDSVKIELSLHNGYIWETITESTPCDGIYEWVVQAQQTSWECKIKISSLSDTTIFDNSDTTFVIDKFPAVDDSSNIGISYEYDLSQNHPNPFNPTTTIRFEINELSNVDLKVFDILGREVISLVREQKQIGSYEVVFDASSLPSGVYYCRLQAVPTSRQAGDFVGTKKMMLIK
jgi:hypothetical protein